MSVLFESCCIISEFLHLDPEFSFTSNMESDCTPTLAIGELVSLQYKWYAIIPVGYQSVDSLLKRM